MAVERAFGMLKCRFRVLLKRCDQLLENMPSIVAACLTLHNICIVHKDALDVTWMDEVVKELEVQACEEDSPSTFASRAAREALFEIRVALFEIRVAHPRRREQQGTDAPISTGAGSNHNEFNMPGYKEGCARRDAMAQALFHVRVKRTYRRVPDFFV